MFGHDCRSTKTTTRSETTNKTTTKKNPTKAKKTTTEAKTSQAPSTNHEDQVRARLESGHTTGQGVLHPRPSTIRPHQDEVRKNRNTARQASTMAFGKKDFTTPLEKTLAIRATSGQQICHPLQGKTAIFPMPSRKDSRPLQKKLEENPKEVVEKKIHTKTQEQEDQTKNEK